MATQSEKKMERDFERDFKKIPKNAPLPTIKTNKKELKEMKTFNPKKTVILTIVATLLTLAAFGAQAYYFYNLGAETKAHENARINAEVVKQVAQLKSNQ